MSVSRNFHMLSEITTGKKVKNMDCLSIAEVVNMDVEVASNLWGVVAALEKNDENSLRKVEKGWEWWWRVWSIDVEQCELSFGKF